MKSLKKAAALRYPENADAPYISASATGREAEKIIETARINGIPVVENKELADVLLIKNVGDFIPESTYSVVAGIFAFISRLERDV